MTTLPMLLWYPNSHLSLARAGDLSTFNVNFVLKGMPWSGVIVKIGWSCEKRVL